MTASDDDPAEDPVPGPDAPPARPAPRPGDAMMAAALAEALAEDAFYAAIAGAAAAAEPLRAYFALAIAEARLRGMVHGGADGAALWHMRPDFAAARTRRAHLAEDLGVPAATLYDRLTGFMARSSGAAMPRGAWYLSVLGVRPLSRGRGIGAALLRQGLAVADGAGVPVALETWSPASVAFYARFGFAETASFPAPVPGATLRLMVRPRGGR